MKKFATGILLLVWCTGADGQAPLVKQWDRRFGGTGRDELESFQQTSDGGYILGCFTLSVSSGDRTQSLWASNKSDYWIVKIDSLGTKEWDKRYGGTDNEWISSLQQTTDGGYIVGGSSTSGTGGDRTQGSWGNLDYWIIKIDALGTKQWDKRFGSIGNDFLFSLQQTADGGYILGGATTSGISGDITEASRGGIYDYWIVKVDSVGNKQWDKRFGGSGYDELFSVQQTTDHGYILGGMSDSPASGDKTQPNWGFFDYWIVKVDSAGNKQWDKRFGGTGGEWCYSVAQTNDGGYILGGSASSGISGDKTQANWDTTLGTNDLWVVKTDSLGNKQWDKRFGGAASERAYMDVSLLTNGGYLVSGSSRSGISGDKSESNLGAEQVWVVKIDSFGNKIWDKTLLTTGALDQWGYSIQTENECFVMTGITTAGIGGYKTQPNWDVTNQTSDCWIIKFCDTTQTQVCNLTVNITAANTLICANGTAFICAPSGFTNYLWNNGRTDSCITTSQAGDYYVTVTDNTGCTAVSNHLAINVYPLPPVSISVSGDTLTAYNAVTYQWYLNGGAINGATNNIYIATQGGSYSVAVTDSNGCAAVSSPVVFTGIDNITEGDVASVYPNPNDFGFWILECGGNYLGGSLEIFDANSRMILSSKLKEQSSKIEFDVSRGVYLLRISSSKSSVVRKLVRL